MPAARAAAQRRGDPDGLRPRRHGHHERPLAVLGLGFSGGDELNFYASSAQYIEESLDERYDWSADVLSPTWDAAAAAHLQLYRELA